MKTFKRIIASTVAALMILASLLTVNVFAAVEFTDVPDDYYYKAAIDSLVTKGIINGYTEEDGTSTFRPENTITRAEFAKLLAASTAKGVELTATTDKFADVPADHWANPYIAYAVKTGAVNGYEDGTFRPSNPVTYGEAIKMLVSVSGNAWLVSAPSDPWYQAWINAGNIIALTKNAQTLGSAEAKRGLVAQLIYNLDYLEQKKPSTGDGPRVNVDDEELEEDKGVVTAVFETTLTGKSAGLNKFQIMINDDVYNIGDYELDNLYPLLGKGVLVEYEEGSGSKRNLVTIEENGKNDTVTIAAEDINDISKDVIEYYPGKSNKLEDAKLASDLYVIYNGYGVDPDDIDSDFIEEYFDIDSGEIELMTNDGDKEYEVAFVTSYETFYVTSRTIDEDVYTIFDSYKGENVTLEESDCTFYKVTEAGGKKNSATISNITEKSVVSVAKPFDRDDDTQVIISTAKISNGEVDEMSDYDDIEISGDNYEVSKYFLDRQEKDEDTFSFSVGDKATFYLDYAGKIVFLTKTENTDPYAYVLGFDNGDGLDGECAINLFAVSGSSAKVVPYKLKSTVKVNGSTKDASEVGGILRDNADAINEKQLDKKVKIENGEYGQLIKYVTTKVGGETVLSEIYTIDPADLEDGEIVPAPFRVDAEKEKEKTPFSDGESKLTYNSSSRAFQDSKKSNQFVINSSTIIFLIPQDRSDDEAIKKRTYSYFSNGNGYVVEPYDVKSNVAKVVLVYTGSGSTASTVSVATNPVLVEDIRTVKSDDGEDTVQQLYYYTVGDEITGEPKKVKTKKDDTLDGIEPGDVIKFVTEDGVIEQAQEVFVGGDLYDYKSNKVYETFVKDENFIQKTYNNNTDYYQVIYGTVDSKDIEEGIGAINVVPGFVEDHKDYNNSDWKAFNVTETAKFYKWDSDNNKFKAASADQINPVEDGTEDATAASKVVIVVMNRKVTGVYIVE